MGKNGKRAHVDRKNKIYLHKKRKSVNILGLVSLRGEFQYKIK